MVAHSFIPSALLALRKGLVLASLFLFAAAGHAAERWVYLADNLLVDQRVESIEALIQRSAKAGYNHLLLSDSKFSRLGEMPGKYFSNAARVKAAAAANNIEIVPAIFPVGYSNDILSQNPNLAEGPPVYNALFVIHGDIASFQSDSPARLNGGDMSDLKTWTMRDPNMIADNGAVRVTDPHGQNARLAQKVSLTPFRQYHITVRVKTQDFKGKPEVKIIAAGRVLNFDDLRVAPTQDWQTHHVVFNSLTNREAMVYLGAWGVETGSLWWDDATLEEIGLVNLIRREGVPFIAALDGGDKLIEGVDFEPVKDPLMGRKPYAGEYDVYHEPPSIHLKRKFPDGTRLRVSYFHVATIYEGQAMIDIAEPAAMDLLRDQARRVHELFHARGYMMSHDEIRVLGWSEAFKRRGLTPGQLLAENARECIRTLRQINPGGRIYVWNDMFDPRHNAVPGPYYLVNGPLTGSWEGLDKEIIIMQWNGGSAQARDQSLKFFADRGNSQILAAYYDAGPDQVRAWLDSARGVPNILGVMYTTWQKQYNDLEAVAALVR